MISLPQGYGFKFIKENIIKQEEYDKMINDIQQHFESEYEKSLTLKPNLKDTTDPNYKGSKSMTHKWENMDFS